jgi:virulence-associated protein VapD
MYAVAFDLVVADTEQHHPKGVTQAYTDSSQSQCAIYAPSVLNSGRISPLW